MSWRNWLQRTKSEIRGRRGSGLSHLPNHTHLSYRKLPFYFGNRGNVSTQRKSLRVAIMEGIPAVVIGNLLGGPILTAYLLFLGANSSEVGLVMAIPPLANLIQLAAAFYMQRLTNRKLYMALSGVLHRSLWVLTGLIPLFVPAQGQVPLFVAMFLLSFLFASISGVFWSSLVADFVPSQVRGRYFGIRNTIHWAIGSIALLLAGQLLERFGEQTAFNILYLIAAICTVWNFYELCRYPNPPFERSATTSKAGMFLKPLGDRTFMKATLYIAMFILIQNIAVPLFSFVMLDILSISYLQLTTITTVQMVVMMVCYYYWGTLNAKYSTQVLLLWAMPIIGLSCIVWAGLAIMPAIVVLVAVHVLLGIGIGGYNLLAFNFMIGETPKSDRPMYIAFFSALTGVAGFIGPLLGGNIYKQISEGPQWLSSYGISTFTGIILLGLSLGVGPLVLSKSRQKISG